MLKSQHDARRTFATNLFYIGMPIKNISQIMGHEAIEQTEQYIKCRPLDDVFDFMEQLSNRNRWNRLLRHKESRECLKIKHFRLPQDTCARGFEFLPSAEILIFTRFQALKIQVEQKWNKLYNILYNIIGNEVMDMGKDVLNIMINNLTNERLDSIVANNQDYIKASNNANTLLDNLDSTLTPEQRRLLDDYCTAQNASSALYARLAYEQGLRDIAELWHDLTDK